MPRLRRHLLARAATLFALLAFVAGLMAQHVHVLRVAHVTCLEHGDVLELAPVSEQAAALDPSLPGLDVASAPAPITHDHDCALSSTLSPTGATQRTALPLSGTACALEASPPALAPTAPPLRWAPKTSPPPLG